MWIALLFIAAAATLLGGFLLDLSGFASNLLAEAFGFAIAVLLGVFVFDELSELRQKQKWRRVRQQTFEALHGHLLGFVARCWLESRLMPMDVEFFTPLSEEHPRISDAAIDSIEKVAQRIRQLGASGNKDDSRLPTREIYEGSRWDVTQVTDALIPRVMDLSTDTVIVERLLDFGKAVRRWELARYLEDPQKRRTGSSYVGEITWEPIAEAVEAAAEVFRRINETYETRRR